MKIWCDVCDKEEASVFCSADEASLCEACDHRVHGANKLASKHQRFSLLRPNHKKSPLCDICRERRAFLFCKEDRAILCRECDIPIHRANEHTKSHNRFLLTGVRLSSSASAYPTSSSSEAETIQSDSTKKGHHSKRPKSGPGELLMSSSSVETDTRLPEMVKKIEDNYIGDTASISASSISEYLETLPGWRVEDLLDPTGYCKTCSQTSRSSPDQGFESDVGTFLSELGSPPFWEREQISYQSKQLLPKNVSMNAIKEYGGCHLGGCAADWEDDGFTVPQMNTTKKSRRLR